MVMHMFNPCNLGENWEFEDNLEYIWDSSLKNKTNKQEEEGKKRAGENIMVRFTQWSNLKADVLGHMS